ncbi:MAG: GNAT family N-acetyltransferase [Desulfurococcales archaeon]|nr:GNAT family N-acetyltransferase [Desulfurococcales archaeon]MCE4628716.1 GNAT family N-acetyltransferase [Desulfurococcales archaeon]
MSSIYVREAVENDIETISELVARLKMLNEELDPHFKAVSNINEIAREYVEKAIQDENTKILVAVDMATADIAGIIILRVEDRVFYEPRKKAVITDFYVKAKYRRKRLGSILLDEAIKVAKEMGAGIITAVYPAGNSIADSFYKKAGFKDFQIEKYKPLD